MSTVIDAQVHAYERDHAGRPWKNVLHGPDEVTGDQMVAAMDDVGVDAAILVSPWTMYRFDASYAVEVQAAHPDRFALVKPIDTRAADITDTISDWADQPGAVGVRIMMVRGVPTDPDDPGVNEVLAAAGKSGLALNLLCWGRLDQVAALAARHPDTRIVIDHLGLQQPFEPPCPPEPFAELPAVLSLASHDNVAIKVTGACTLSQQGYPYADIWEPVERIIESFGIDRCMWGTDWTRAVELLTFRQGVDAFRESASLSPAERDALMGGTLSDIYGWTPPS
ncbi:MAG: amidohydrolase family protein [Actinomycetota bacterium]|nr:amidohydrolase family protein [Actinomycetota bacterium]